MPIKEMMFSKIYHRITLQKIKRAVHPQKGHRQKIQCLGLTKKKDQNKLLNKIYQHIT